MSDDDWNNPESRCFALRLAGDAIEESDARGNAIVDDTLLILLNAYHEPVPFTLPAHRRKVRWQVILDTYDGKTAHRSMRGGETYDLKARSLALLCLPKHVEGENDSGEHRGRRNGPVLNEPAR
jgi:glycogen operon protein